MEIPGMELINQYFSMSKHQDSTLIHECSTNASSINQDAQTPTSGSISESQLPQLSIQEQRDEGNSPSKTVDRTKWNDKENRLLITAWLNTSKDPLTGIGRKNEGFYRRVQSYYNENRSKDMKERTWRVIKDRWHRLKQTIPKFAECYARAAQPRQSGYSEAHIIQVAGEFYKSEVGKKFICMQAWRLLKDEPKWRSELQEGLTSKRTKVSASGAYTLLSNAATEALTPTIQELPQLERPMGIEATKRKERARETETSSEFSLAFNLMEETTERKLIALEQLARAKEEEAKAKQRQIDIDVVFKDTSNMTKEQLEIHKMMCEQIKEKLKRM